MRNKKQKSAQVEVMWEREIEISRRSIAEERRRTAEQQKNVRGERDREVGGAGADRIFSMLYACHVCHVCHV